MYDIRTDIWGGGFQLYINEFTTYNQQACWWALTIQKEEEEKKKKRVDV